MPSHRLKVVPVVVPLLLLVAACGQWAAASEFVVEKDVMVPMRDGVRLATDIYRPAVDGKPVDEALPVILTRLPYNKEGSKRAGEYYAKNGYVFVSQDTPSDL